MSSIVPTVLTDKPEEYQALMQTYANFTGRIQIDITDRQFAANPTVRLEEIGWSGNLDIDLHLMVQRPSEYLPLVLEKKPSLAIFHAECNEDLLPVFQTLHEAGIRAGVAFLVPSFPGNYKPYLAQADCALIFAGTLGENSSGNKGADLLQTEKTHLIREINGKLEIGWDGGANLENVFMITKSGVDVINVGSALRTENPAETFKALQREANREGAI